MRDLRRTLAVVAAMVVVTVVPTAAAEVAVQSVAAASAPGVWSPVPAQDIDEGQICPPSERTRFTDCRTNIYHWNIHKDDPVAGPIIGTLTARLTLHATLASNNKDWSATYSVFVWDATEAAAVGTTMSVVAECSGQCTVSESPQGAQSVGKNSTVVGGVKFTASAAGQATSRQKINLFFFNAAAVNSGTTTGDVNTELGPVRCDDAVAGEGNGGNGTPGCVMKEVPGMFQINSPGCVGKGCVDHRAFVARAQANPYTQKWGVLGAGKPLTRQVLPVRAQKSKRNKVCPPGFAKNPDQADLPQGALDSCDEYPFSSTYQGVPEFAVKEILPGWDNGEGGLQVQDFYRVNHILDGDPFYVVP